MIIICLLHHGGDRKFTAFPNYFLELVGYDRADLKPQRYICLILNLMTNLCDCRIRDDE